MQKQVQIFEVDLNQARSVRTARAGTSNR